MTEAGVVWAVTWIWQGAALTLAVAGALKLAGGLSAATRFVVWWVTLLAVLALAPLAMTKARAGEPGSEAAHHVNEAVLSTASTGDEAEPVILLPRPPVWLAPGLAFVWAVTVGRRLVGFIRELAALSRAKRRCVPVSRKLERQLSLWETVRGAGRRTRLCVSDQVSAASMLGFGTPVIAISSRLIGSLSGDELDRIVLHEFGHVQRRDDWTSAAQVMIEALVAWHPAVWWIGRQLHLEREVACDDWVVARTATPHAYASCLAKVAGLTRASRHGALAPGAVRSRRTLRIRVDRLLTAHRSITTRPARTAVAVGGVGVVITSTALGLSPPLLGTLQNDVLEPLRASALSAIVALPAGAGRAIRSTLRELDAADDTTPPATTIVVPRPSPRATLIPEVAFADLTLEPLLREPRPTGDAAGAGEPPRLASTILRLDIATAPPGPAGLQRVSTNPGAKRPGKGPWRHVANAGRVVGDRAGRAGRATALAFRDAGVSIANVFRR